MSSTDTFTKTALAFDHTDTKTHFDRLAFRVKGRIFATLAADGETANLRLSLENQYVFSKSHAGIYPVKGGWGRMGWTTIEYKRLPKSLLKEILTSAYFHVSLRKKS